MPQASVAPRAGARAAAIIARRCAASVTRSSAGSGRWSSGGCPVAVVAATLSSWHRSWSIHVLTRASTARRLSWACLPQLRRGAVARRYRRIPRRETLCVHFNTVRRERLDLEASRTPKKGCPGIASRSPYHEGVRFSRYKLRSTLARHERNVQRRVDRCPPVFNVSQRLQARAQIPAR